MGTETMGTGIPSDASPIVQTGAQVLRARASEVSLEELRSEAFQALIASMVAAMREAPGVGLAAPQIGIGKRVFVVEDRAELLASLPQTDLAARERIPVALRVFVNPVVTPLGVETVTFFEGCLSVSGFSALVPRYREVEVRALDEHGEAVVWKARGWPARILQHEMDHLDGTLYVDRMLSRSFGTVAHTRARFAGKSTAEVLDALER